MQRKRKEKRDTDPKIEPHSSKLPRPKIKNRNLSNVSWTLKGTGGLPPVEGRKMLALALESTPNCSLHVRRPTIPNGNTRDRTRKDEQTGGTERRRITGRGSPRNPSARDPIIFCYNDSAARNGMAVAPPTIYAPKKRDRAPNYFTRARARGTPVTCPLQSTVALSRFPAASNLLLYELSLLSIHLDIRGRSTFCTRKCRAWIASFRNFSEGKGNFAI